MESLLKSSGFTSNTAYTAAGGSILLSILIWVTRRGGDKANAERFGIFVGLWAPTFMTLGKILEDREKAA